MAEPNSNQKNSVNDADENSESRNPNGSGLNSSQQGQGGPQGIRPKGGGSRSPFGDLATDGGHIERGSGPPPGPLGDGGRINEQEPKSTPRPAGAQGFDRAMGSGTPFDKPATDDSGQKEKNTDASSPSAPSKEPPRDNKKDKEDTRTKQTASQQPDSINPEATKQAESWKQAQTDTQAQKSPYPGNQTAPPPRKNIQTGPSASRPLPGVSNPKGIRTSAGDGTMAGPRRTGPEQAAYDAGRVFGGGKNFIDKSFDDLQKKSIQAGGGDKENSDAEQDNKKGYQDKQEEKQRRGERQHEADEGKDKEGQGKDGHHSYAKGIAHDAAHHTGLGMEAKFDKLAGKAMKAAGKEAPHAATGSLKERLKDTKGSLGKIALDSIAKHQAQELAKKLKLTNYAMLLTVQAWLILGWLTFINGAGILFTIPAMLVASFPWISPKYAYKSALLIVSLFASPAVYKYGQYVNPSDLKIQTWQKILIVFSHFAMATVTLLITVITVAGFCYTALNASYITQGALYVTSKSAYNFCQAVVGQGPDSNAIPPVNTGP